MFCSPSTLLALFALVAASTEVSALPTRRSTSGALSRRGSNREVASLRARRAPSFQPLGRRNDAGDESILVDAATAEGAPPGSKGGITGSTVNLTVINKKAKRDSILVNRLARAVRSLFAATPVAAPVVRARNVYNPKKRHQSFANNKKRTLPPHMVAAAAEKRGLMGEDIAAQQSIYAAQIAALSAYDNQPTSTTSAALVATPVPINAAVIKVADALDNSTILAEEPVANSTSSTLGTPRVLPDALASNSTSEFVDSSEEASLEPITLTVTLVANPTGAGYVDQAALAPASSVSGSPLVDASTTAGVPTSTVVVRSTSTILPARSSDAEFASTTGAPQRFAKFKRSHLNKRRALEDRAAHAGSSWELVENY